MNTYQGKSNELFINEAHVEAIEGLFRNKPYFPEFLEIYPTNPCNHKCTFCISADYRTTKEFLDTNTIKNVLSDAADGGVKMVRFCGGGEPLLHPDMAEIIAFAKNKIASVNLITNGSMLKLTKLLTAIAENCNEIRISIDAGDSGSYAKVHGTTQKSFGELVINISKLLALRGTRTAPFVELSFVAIDENIDSLDKLIGLANEIGVDRLNISTSMMESQEKKRGIIKRIEESIEAHSNSKVELYWHDVEPDTFVDTELPCVASLLFGLVSANAKYFSTCHHVGNEIYELGDLTTSESFRRLLADPELIKKQLNYAFGKTTKCEKLLYGTSNYILLNGVMGNEKIRNEVTTWMSENSN